jgi:subtilisin family serine protease
VKKLALIGLLTISFNTFATEYILEVKSYEGFNNKNIQKKFEILGKKYLVIETDFLPQSENIISSSINHETSIFNNNAYTPKVVDFHKQWGLFNEGKNEPITPDRMSPVGSVPGTDINIRPVWDELMGDKNIVIAVVDTGLDLKHKELISNIWINQSELNGKPGVDDDGNGFIDDINGYDFTGKEDSVPQDEHGHGTHCAGIIGAPHTSGKIAGVMSEVSIMALRTLDKKGAGKVDQAVRAFGYAIENGAHIISNSWGSRGHNEILESLINEANKRGIIVIAAAGNSRYNDNDLNPTYPANYPHVISVSSVNARARHASYSSFGKTTVHIGAPGTNILSTHTLKKGLKYRVMSGTSMAAPHISGIIGLYLAKHGVNQDPLLIKNKLISTAIKLDHLKGMNQADGMVDAFNFLK